MIRPGAIRRADRALPGRADADEVGALLLVGAAERDAERGGDLLRPFDRVPGGRERLPSEAVRSRRARGTGPRRPGPGTPRRARPGSRAVRPPEPPASNVIGPSDRSAPKPADPPAIPVADRTHGDRPVGVRRDRQREPMPELDAERGRGGLVAGDVRLHRARRQPRVGGHPRVADVEPRDAQGALHLLDDRRSDRRRAHRRRGEDEDHRDEGDRGDVLGRGLAGGGFACARPTEGGPEKVRPRGSAGGERFHEARVF